MRYNKTFLKLLDQDRSKIIYAKIIALQLDESPIETIEGRVTQGSINVDGDSAVRRTCSLQIVADNFDYNEFIWGLNTKFKLEVGVENNIDLSYPKIIWFKQGTYFISQFSTSQSTGNFNISISGKDKMCALNGEIGGLLTSSVDFGTVTDVITVKDENNNSSKITKITKLNIKEIIKNIVHLYGGEPIHNIIINDLDMSGLELLEYRYDTPMYLYRDAIPESCYDNVTLYGNKECQVLDSSGQVIRTTTLAGLEPTELEQLVNAMTGSDSPSVVRFPNEIYDNVLGTHKDLDVYIAKISYGETAGYRFTELTYPGDLIGAIGEALTSILDKIKNMLGDFEYFYDLDGQFIFQRKKTLSTTWSPLSTQGTTSNISYDNDDISYTFIGGELVTTFNNNPDLNNLKNDYSVWGERCSITGQAIPVHMRYAIDKKPVYYKAFDGKIYTTDEQTFRAMLEQALQDIKTNYFNKINSFKHVYEVPIGLTAPTKLDDGNWSAGWWDIRDWYQYYILLTGETPNYTMKWYSQNDETGCIPINTIPGYSDRSGYCWLIIKNKNSTSYNFQHGSGSPQDSAATCTLYHSYYLEDGSYKTEKVLDADGQTITKEFIPPYRTCSDNHTYIEFLEKDIKRDDNQVFFYNPKFPNYDSMQDLVEDQLKQEWENYLASGKLNFVDWREIIYQMAKDYYSHNIEDDFTTKVSQNNYLYYPSGKTGYENYYIDLLSFWRDIYDPSDERDLNNYYDNNNVNKYWSKTVYEAPQNLNFWFDFLDTEGELSQFSVKNVGCRPKAVNDSNVKAIYFREIPNVVFTTNYIEDRKQSSAYTYINANKAGINTMFSISAQGKSAKDTVDSFLSQHGYCVESATINSIPIYYLEPNSKIHIIDDKTGLDGYYSINKMSIPLSYNGTMSITAKKIGTNI